MLNLLVNYQVIHSGIMSRNNNDNRIFKKLTTRYMNLHHICIEYLKVHANFELKSKPIQLLSIFYGLVGEDPHKHRKEFNVVCFTIKPKEIPKEQIKLF